MRIVPRSAYRSMPWKNGKGATEEILVFPAHSTLDTFQWRISLAHIEADGPFSAFAGIDRSIALVAGRGVSLHLPDQRTGTLEAGDQPFSFPGEWALSGRNLDGPTTDLNVMTRRGPWSHAMHRYSYDAPETFVAKDRLLLFVAGAAGIEDMGNEGHGMVQPWDSVWLEPQDAVRLVPQKPCDILAISLIAHADRTAR